MASWAGGYPGTEGEEATLQTHLGNGEVLLQARLSSSFYLLDHTTSFLSPFCRWSFSLVVFTLERVEGRTRTRSKGRRGKRIVVLEFL